jgi:hypothetical protein
MDFNLQDIGIGGGWSVSDDSKPDGTTGFDWTSALENVGVNFAAGAASVGLQTLAKSQGVSASYINPYTQPRGQVLVPTTNRLGFGTGTGSALLVGTLGVAGLGLLLFLALRKKG